MVLSENRYRAVFGFLPELDLESMPRISVVKRLPETLDEAINLSRSRNTDLAQAQFDEALARQDVRATWGSEFFPTLEGVVERKFKNNVGGTLNSKEETLAKIELSMPFNLGFTAINSLKAAKSGLRAKARTLANTRRTVEEAVRNAWQQRNTAHATANALRTQAQIAGAFLELARQERKLGQRSLIDVLAGETSLANAESDAASAETDVLVAKFNLLRVTGQLYFDSFEETVPVKNELDIKTPDKQGPGDG